MTGTQPPGGAAGCAEPGAGDRTGEDLDDGVLPGGQAAAGGGEGPQRIAAVIGFEGENLGAGQPQRPPRHQRTCREGWDGGGGDGVGAGPGGLDGPLEHAGRHRPGDPHPDRHHRARPGVLEPDMRLPMPQAGPPGAQQPAQVPPQRLPASRVRQRRRQHPDHPRAVGEGSVVAPPQPRPAQQRCGKGGRQQRAGHGALVADGVQQYAGGVRGHRARVDQVPAQRADRGSRTWPAPGGPDHRGEAATRHSRPSPPGSLSRSG